MAIALVAHTARALPTSGATVAIDTMGANLLVMVQTQWTGVGIANVSDSKGNTWTALTARTSQNNYLRMHWCKPTSVGAGHTFSLTGPGTFYGALAVAAFSGATAAPFDGENGQGTPVTSTSYSPGPITPTQNNDLLLTAISNGGGSGATVDQAFIITDALNWGSGTNEPVALAYRLQATAATIQPTWTWTTAGDPAAVIAAFRAVQTGIIVAPASADMVYAVNPLVAMVPTTAVRQPALVSAPRAIGALTVVATNVVRNMTLVSAPRVIGSLVVTPGGTVVRFPATVTGPRTVQAVSRAPVGVVSRAPATVAAPRAIGNMAVTPAGTTVRQPATVQSPRTIGGVTVTASGTAVRQMVTVGSPSAVYAVTILPFNAPPDEPVVHLHFSGTVDVPGVGDDLSFTGTIDVPRGTNL